MSEENPWKPGDVVQVKSGGPPMTVAGEDEIGMVICEWFVGTNPQTKTFNAAVLKKYETQTAHYIVRG
jgi:uncharacterized protein YodC (DUF2158 family)